MKPIAIVTGAVLAVLLFASCGAEAQPAQPAQPSQKAERTRRAAQFDAAEAALQRRLATPEAARVFRVYNATSSQKIQQHLALVYRGNAAFARDAAAKGNPLGDSIVGPITLKWLKEFCKDYGIVANEPRFEHVVVSSLEQVASIARAHPEWQTILSSEDFDDWIRGQPTPERVESLRKRRSGAASQVNALIEQYLKDKGGATAPARPATPLELTFGYDGKRPARIEHLDLIAERLKPLARRGPDEEAVFVDDVRAALDGVPVSEDTLGLVKRYSQVEAYQLSPALLQRLRREGLPEPAVVELQTQLGGTEYLSTQEFQDALSEVSAASVHREVIERQRRAIVRGARVARYRIPETIVADLSADKPLAPEVAAVFAGIHGVEYPTRELFDRALEWQVRRALAMCTEPGRLPQGELSNAQFDALAAVIPEHADMFARIRPLRAVRTGCNVNQLVEADELAYRAYLFIAPRLDRKMVFEVLHAMPPPKARTSGWAVPWCRCGRDPRDGLTYGFYPLWLDAGERQIDFGALSRIGLYGLSADRRGALSGPSGMEGSAVPSNVAELMRAAHRHNVRTDWVVARNEWGDWRGATRLYKKEVLDQLARNIVALLERPLPDSGAAFSSLPTFGADPGPTGGDGVALYFRNFPAVDRQLFNDFVAELDATLRTMQPARSLSIVADQGELGSAGIYGLANLAGLVERTNPMRDEVAFANSGKMMMDDISVLVMMPEATRDSKKALRGMVQDTLRGIDSMRLLNAFVPIVEYDGVGSQQLADDIVYISDNYFGIGFWPLPFAREDDHVGRSAAETLSVNRLLSLYFQPAEHLGSGWEHLSGYLCPHRLWLRWLFWASFAAAVVVGAVYFSCRGCNERLDESGLYFFGMLALLALPLVTLAVLIVSDPLLEPYMLWALVMYGTGGIVAAALVARYYFNKSRRKLP